MPVLSDPRWEQFAQLLAKGMPTKRAYSEAGYASTGGKAYALAGHPKIKQRLNELEKRSGLNQGQTLERLVAELDDMYVAAKQQGQPAAGVTAVMGKAKLLGLIVDKSEIETTLRKPLREPGKGGPMSLEDWKKKFAPKTEAS